MIKIKKDKLIMIIVVTVIATLTLTAGALYLLSSAGDITFVRKSTYQSMKEVSSKYEKLNKIQTLVDEKSLWNVDKNVEMETIYDSLVGTLKDPYSEYLNADEVKKWNDAMDGSFSGVGISFIQSGKNEYKIVTIIEGSPAASSGLKKDDIILSVDGKEYTDSTEMAKVLRGEEGTKVSITFRRGDSVKKAAVVRGKVKETTVGSSILEGNIGYIVIGAFENGTAEEFKTELTNLENKGVKAMIIDLRENGGGYTKEGVKIADMLLPECTITYTADKSGKKQYYNSDENYTKIKYAVLVNKNTASTSEILAAAIKDNKGGAVVGETTYGKGIIQRVYDLGDGTALKLTILQYFSPNGTKIHEAGVTPDYKVELKATDKVDTQLLKAKSLLS